jgi:ADP-heptose:LPS heptosyltransferase
LHRTIDTDRLIYCFEKEIEDPMEYLGYVEGWCMLWKSSSVRKLNGFDEVFSPGYCEDSDLCWRAKEKGMKLGKIKDLPIMHYRGKTSDQLGNIPRLSEKNGGILYNRWAKGRTIILRRRGAMGDVLMTTPVIRRMKELYPKKDILLATDCPELIQGNPNITGVVPFNQQIDIDGAMDVELRYEEFPKKNAIEVMLRQAGIYSHSPKVGLEMDCFLGESDNPQLKKANLSKVVVFHTGRSWKNREWDIRNFKRIGFWLLGLGYTVVELGDTNTRSISLGRREARFIDARGRPWEHSARWIREAQFFVGIDSAPSNVAKAVGTPAFIIYGCTDPETRKAGAEEYPLVVEDLECAGCRNETKAEMVHCKLSEPLCVTRLTVSHVQNEIEKYLKGEREARQPTTKIGGVRGEASIL